MYQPIFVNQTTVPVADSDAAFPVRRIFCVARNYPEHVREMGGDGRDTPFFFTKPTDAVLPVSVSGPGRMAYPPRTANLHHEVEMVLALGAGGRDLSVEQAAACVFGCAIGIDMTRRDLQTELKAKGRPWDMAKGFDQSAPIGPIHPVSEVPRRGAITLAVNSEEKQRGNLSDMLWSPPEILAELSTYVELKAGDLVFTGTPAGVGPVNRGDVMSAAIEGLGAIVVRVV